MPCKFRNSSFCVIFLLLFLSSCGKQINLNSSTMKHPKIIGNSFVVSEKKKNSESTSQTSYIGIKTTALGQEHLLQGSVIVQSLVGRFNNLKSRIIIFEKVDKSLYMLEATHGHSINHDLPQNFVLAKFPILEETEDLIYFDFSSGMSKVFVSSDWEAQDFSGSSYKENSWDTVELDVSYIKSAKIDTRENLVIRQLAQSNELSGVKKGKVPVELKYYISPYKANPNFVPTESKNFKKMGFFEIAPQLKPGGKNVVYASKFDLKKPIIFAVSANTPKEYRDAVKEGALYWNKSFGSEVIKVIDAPEGVSAPDFNYNIIQWVNWKTAGFAYADAQMDPRTGEILHAQIFLTSVFAFSSKKKARNLLNLIKSSPSNGKNHHHNHDHDHNSDKYDPQSYVSHLIELMKEKNPFHLNLKGFEKKAMCNFQPSQSMITGLVELLATGEDFSDETYLKISRDYVREVVAHEVGHTLGLRHNFAGSLYTNFELSEKKDIFLNYAKEGKAPAHIRTTSSVMEYQNFEESVMTGDQLLRKEEPLDYDKIVIQSLYFGKKFKKSSIPPFCTDSHRSKYLDCQTFDSGKSIYKNSLWQEKRAKENIPFLLLRNYIKAKELIASGDLNSLGEATPNPLMYNLSYLQNRMKILQSLSTSSSFLQVERSFPFVNSLNSDEIKEANQTFVSEKIKEVGGLNNLFQHITQSELDKLKAKFHSLLENYNEKNGLEVNYFTPEEIFLVKAQVNEFFKQFKKSHFLLDLSILNTAKNLRKHQISNDFLKILFQRAKDTILKTNGTEEVVTEKKTYQIPKYVFTYKVRLLATQLLKSKSEDLIWGLKEKAQIKTALLQNVKDVFGDDLARLKVTSLPDKLSRWALENNSIMRKLL